MSATDTQKPSFVSAFTEHPASVGESYWGHMGFAFRLCARLMGMAGAAALHGLVPAWCETTASDRLADLHRELSARKSQG